MIFLLTPERLSYGWIRSLFYLQLDRSARTAPERASWSAISLPNSPWWPGTWTKTVRPRRCCTRLSRDRNRSRFITASFSSCFRHALIHSVIPLTTYLLSVRISTSSSSATISSARIAAYFEMRELWLPLCFKCFKRTVKEKKMIYIR
jgi:hypothetical protein